MTIVNGRFVSDSVSDVLDALVAGFESNIGDELPNAQASFLRTLYLPVAEQIVDLQNDAGLVLDASQIDYASGTALDLLTALIGVPRRDAQKATGTVAFSRASAAAQDYTIPAGTRVQTESTDPVAFETDAEATLTTGSTSVDVDVTAVTAGQQGNVAAGTVTVLLSSVPGVESVENGADMTGGADGESDDALRARAKDSVAQGKSATAKALIEAVEELAGVTKVDIFINNTGQDNTGIGGLPDHSFELIVDGGADADIGQAILDTMAAGATPYGGASGSAVTVAAGLPSGQTEDVSFSRPISVTLYVEAEIEVDSEYVGDSVVMDNIVDYLGGVLTDGQTVSGDVDMGDEVLVGEVEYAIRSTHGVYDVTALRVDTVDPAINTANIQLAPGETVLTDAQAGHVSLTTTGA